MSATQHVEWHERIRAILDAEITNPDFVLWILVAMEPDASVDDDALLRNVGAWLEGLDVKRVFDARDEPTHIYEDQGLVIRFTAVPRAPAARGLEIPTVANAVAPEVHGTRVIRSDTGAPTRAQGDIDHPRAATGSTQEAKASLSHLAHCDSELTPTNRGAGSSPAG